VNGETRNALIHTFRLHKGMTYVPHTVHPAIKWSKKDPMLDPIADALPWKIVTTKESIHSSSSMTKVSNEMPATPLKCSKRKEITPEKEHRTKIYKTTSKVTKQVEASVDINVQSLTPVGTAWSQNSCAYDAVLCIMHSIWSSNKGVFTDIFRNLNDILGNLALSFIKHASGAKTLESARDDTRHQLCRIAPSQFAWGAFTSVASLVDYLLTMPTTAIQNDYICNNGHISTRRRTNNTCCLLTIASTPSNSVSNWMQELKEESNVTCGSCSEKMTIKHQLLLLLPFIALHFSNQQLQIDYNFHISINNEEFMYELRGIVYYGDSHFTARVISNDGLIWFHDGIATGQSLRYEGTFQNFTESLNLCQHKAAIMAIYVKV
jgi:hypothetical protein